MRRSRRVTIHRFHHSGGHCRTFPGAAALGILVFLKTVDPFAIAGRTQRTPSAKELFVANPTTRTSESTEISTGERRQLRLVRVAMIGNDRSVTDSYFLYQAVPALQWGPEYGVQSNTHSRYLDTKYSTGRNDTDSKPTNKAICRPMHHTQQLHTLPLCVFSFRLHNLFTASTIASYGPTNASHQ